MLGEKVNLGRESGISSICGEKYISYLIYNIRKKKPFGKCTSKEIINTYDVFLCIVYSHTNKPHVGLKKKKKNKQTTCHLSQWASRPARKLSFIIFFSIFWKEKEHFDFFKFYTGFMLIN